MSIDITNKTKENIKISLVKSVAEKFLKKYNKQNQDLSVVFVGDKRIRSLNKIYRGYDKTTDILSFEGEDDLFGELIIDFAQIKRQANNFNNTVNDELVFILVHGLYHLLGHNDETEIEEKKMIKLGETFIKSLKK